jgi:hypothetical protein
MINRTCELRNHPGQCKHAPYCNSCDVVLPGCCCNFFYRIPAFFWDHGTAISGVYCKLWTKSTTFSRSTALFWMLRQFCTSQHPFSGCPLHLGCWACRCTHAYIRQTIEANIFIDPWKNRSIIEYETKCATSYIYVKVWCMHLPS